MVGNWDGLIPIVVLMVLSAASIVGFFDALN